MKAVIQKVTAANVTVENKIVADIKRGLLVLIGFEDADTIDDIKWLTAKIVNLRIFELQEDSDETLNFSVKDIDGDIIVVSQFTLQASTRKGNRPSYIKAAKPAIAVPLYQKFTEQMEIDLEKKILTGVFGADMKVALINDGPVTIVIDTKNKE